MGCCASKPQGDNGVPLSTVKKVAPAAAPAAAAPAAPEQKYEAAPAAAAPAAAAAAPSASRGISNWKKFTMAYMVNNVLVDLNKNKPTIECPDYPDVPLEGEVQLPAELAAEAAAMHAAEAALEQDERDDDDFFDEFGEDDSPKCVGVCARGQRTAGAAGAVVVPAWWCAGG